MILEAIIYREDEVWKYLVSMDGGKPLIIGNWDRIRPKCKVKLPSMTDAVVHICHLQGEHITPDMVKHGSHYEKDYAFYRRKI